jgi:molybdopterin converting factor small subunit
MKIKIRLFSTLKRYLPEGKDGSEREIPERSRVGEVMTGLGIPKATMAVILVNGRLADGDKELSPGDELVLFPPVEGG